MRLRDWDAARRLSWIPAVPYPTLVWINLAYAALSKRRFAAKPADHPNEGIEVSLTRSNRLSARLESVRRLRRR